MTDIKSMLLSELQEDFALRGLQKFRAAQVYRWLHQRGTTSFDEMTDLSVALRKKLAEVSFVSTAEIERLLVSKIDGTRKYLFRLGDGNMVESVAMYYKHGISVCISCQVGCQVLCVNDWRTGAQLNRRGDIKPSPVCAKGHRRENIQYRDDGNRRADG